VVIGYEVHERISTLAQARMTARANVRIAPRRWHLRTVVDAEDRRIARLNVLADGTLSLVRAVTVAIDDGESLPMPLQAQIASFASVLRTLAGTPPPWPQSVLRDAADAAHHLIAHATSDHADRSPVVATVLRAGARDLLEFSHAAL
jgi:hypothetical protein